MNSAEDERTDEQIDEVTGEVAGNVLSPEQRIARYRKTREDKEASMVSGKPTPLEEGVALVAGCGTIILAFVFGITLLFKGCAYLGERNKETEGRALLCSSAREDLDQVKRLRDNGFANESAVRVMERKHDETCTW